MIRDFSEKYNRKKVAENLIRKIKEDTLFVGVPNYTQEDVEKVESHVVIWNLFYGKYQFSATEFKEILNLLYKS